MCGTCQNYIGLHLRYLGVQLQGEGHEMEKNSGTNLFHSFPCYSNFLPRIGKNKTSKCGFESFPRMMMYILCVKNVRATFLHTVVSQLRGDCSII